MLYRSILWLYFPFCMRMSRYWLNLLSKKWQKVVKNQLVIKFCWSLIMTHASESGVLEQGNNQDWKSLTLQWVSVIDPRCARCQKHHRCCCCCCCWWRSRAWKIKVSWYLHKLSWVVDRSSEPLTYSTKLVWNMSNIDGHIPAETQGLKCFFIWNIQLEWLLYFIHNLYHFVWTSGQ